VKETHIRKPNSIIQAGQSLTASQSKMLFSMLSRFKYLAASGDVDSEKLSNVTYSFPLKEFMPQFNGKNPNGESYELARKQVAGVVQQFLRVKNGKTTEFYNIVSYAKVVEGGSDVHARFNQDIIGLLTDMVKEGYTQIAFEDVYQMKSAYSIRIYELLQKNRRSPQVKKQGYYEITVEELRFLLGIDEKKYKRFQDFKKRVLIAAEEEINEKTSLRFTIEPVYAGRKIIALQFRDIVEVDPVILNEGQPEEVSTEQFCLDLPVPGNPLLEGLHAKSRREIEENHSEEYIQHYHKKAKQVEAKGRMKSTFANLLFGLLNKDPDDFYTLEERKKAEAEQKKAAALMKRQAEEEKKQLEAEREKEQAKKFKNAELLFDNLDEGDKKKRLLKEKESAPFLSEKFLREHAIIAYAKEVQLW
jgi:plasmid replication initiation protein